MNEAKNTLLTIVYITAGLLLAGSTVFGIYQRNSYTRLRSSIDAANFRELERRLESVYLELERTKGELAESRESLEQLKELDQRRLGGIERIQHSIEAIGRRIGSVAGGNERAEIALRGIAELVELLEKEFGRGPGGN